MDQQDHKPTNGEPPETVEQKIDRLALAVKEGLDGVDAQLKAVDERFDRVESDITVVKTTMVTKDYLDEKLADLKGDLILKLRKTNEKLDFIVSLLRAHAVLSDDDLKRIRTEFQIFPQLS